ncbi:hypothetical protein RvY_04042-2 [Ramazzottius varieornatus]|uniref:RRM domain-containing protein n=1 Tax=Ramazzottius varieornatus TaxID=947166 RepID=A0A1D1UTR4_RAMVA|nr:hypothetical protein RvY_04042-2 [Ramazzottius varieornatus]
MSRLIIKNLPNGITEKRLRSVFEEKGTITDVKLKYGPNGVFRKFAFIGFQREEDAQAAQTYFHNTFIDTSRIQVEPCRHLGDADNSRSWSQHSADSSRFSKAHPDKKPKEIKKEKPAKQEENRLGQLLRNPLLTDKEKEAIESLRNDPQFLEFFSINQRGKDTANKGTWSNDDAAAELKSKKGLQVAKNVQEDVEETTKPNENFNKMKDALKIKHLPKGVNKAIIREFFVGLNPLRVHLPKKAKDIAFVQFSSKADVAEAKTFDKKQMLGQTVTVTECENPVEEDNEVSSTVKDKAEVGSRMEADDSSITEHGRLFVRNLPFFCTIEDIEKLFEKFGPISEVKLPTDFITNQAKGYSIVTFMMPEHAVKALTMDGKAFQGRTIHVMPAKPKPEETQSTKRNNGTESSFKKEKSKQTKDDSTKAVHSWNSLFLGVNSVMDIMAQRYKVSKNEILETNAGGQSAAVKVALGETQIVKETKEFLEENGVKLEAFNEKKGRRSRTVMLVKNLPAGTPSGEVQKLFEPFGAINRLLLPPAGVTAIVEMLNINEAKKAFRSLAYYKFGSVPLFLEWAPVDALSETKPSSPSKARTKNKSAITVDAPDTPSRPQTAEESVAEAVEDNEGNEGVGNTGSTLFVKNLNFSTTDEALRNVR